MRDFRTSIMAPIGEPINITGLNPIFKRPEPIVPPGPTIRPPRRPRPRKWLQSAQSVKRKRAETARAYALAI